MSSPKKNTNKAIKNEQSSKLLVSEDGIYLKNDTTGEFIKKMHEMIKQTTFLPAKPSTSK